MLFNDVLNEHNLATELDWRATKLSKGTIKNIVSQDDEEDADSMAGLLETAELKLAAAGSVSSDFPSTAIAVRSP